MFGQPHNVCFYRIMIKAVCTLKDDHFFQIWRQKLLFNKLKHRSICKFIPRNLSPLSLRIDKWRKNVFNFEGELYIVCSLQWNSVMKPTSSFEWILTPPFRYTGVTCNGFCCPRNVSNLVFSQKACSLRSENEKLLKVNVCSHQGRRSWSDMIIHILSTAQMVLPVPKCSTWISFSLSGLRFLIWNRRANSS